MTNQQLEALAHQLDIAGTALKDAADLLIDLAPSVPDDIIKTPADLDAAMANAKPGDVLILRHGTTCVESGQLEGNVEA